MGLPKYGGRSNGVPILDHRKSASPWQITVPPQASTSASAAQKQKDQPEKPLASDAERARLTVNSGRTGVLTASSALTGAPLGVVAPYSVETKGALLVGLHESIVDLFGLAGEVSMSFAVSESPMTARKSRHEVGGVTLSGSGVNVALTDEIAMADFARSQPDVAIGISRGNGQLWRICVDSVFVTGGSNVIHVEPSEYAEPPSEAAADTLAPKFETRTAGDDTAALVVLCRAFGGHPTTTSAQLAGIDSKGMDVIAATASGREQVRLTFNHPANSPEDVRREMAVMVRAARFKLGVG